MAELWWSANGYELSSAASFWQVVAVGGDGTAAQGQGELSNIQGIIASLKFL